MKPHLRYYFAIQIDILLLVLLCVVHCRVLIRRPVSRSSSLSPSRVTESRRSSASFRHSITGEHARFVIAMLLYHNTTVQSTDLLQTSCWFNRVDWKCWTWKWRTACACSNRRITLIFDIFRIGVVAGYRGGNGMLNLLNLFIRRLSHLSQFHIVLFRVQWFHVLLFHALHIGPSISRPSFSRPAFSAPPFNIQAGPKKIWKK